MTFSVVQQSNLLNLARATIRQALSDCSVIRPPVADPALQAPAGAFVTLHTLHGHRLRGCIGRLIATDPLDLTVVDMSQSVLKDPRFRTNPITLDELTTLELEITVLSPLQPCKDVMDFDLQNDGIYLTCQGQTGTFLPQVARETGWDKPTLLTRLVGEKMGLAPTAWRDPSARMQRYQAFILGPEPFVLNPGQSHHK